MKIGRKISVRWDDFYHLGSRLTVCACARVVGSVGLIGATSYERFPSRPALAAGKEAGRVPGIPS